MSERIEPKLAKKSDHIKKGDLAEEVVALMHRRQGELIELKKRMPTTFDPTFIREIDILVTHSVAGYPVRIAIECKNRSSVTTPGEIDEFIGKLQSVGIPPQHGIFVSVAGFTKQASALALSQGVKTLILEGLTADRLDSVLHSAYQSFVYQLLTVKSLTVTNEIAEPDPSDLLILADKDGNLAGTVMDCVWNMWINGEIPLQWGEQEVEIKIPVGWHWQNKGIPVDAKATSTVQVIGVVATIEGVARQYGLLESDRKRLARTHISAAFDVSRNSIPVALVESEEELANALSRDGIVNVKWDPVPLPRILGLAKCFWPPSDRALSRIGKKAFEAVRSGDLTLSSMSGLGFIDIEGASFERVWDPISRSHPAAIVPGWPNPKVE